MLAAGSVALATPINDLGSDQSVTLDVKVQMSTISNTGKKMLGIVLNDNYTNTLVCDISLSLDTASGATQRLTLTDIPFLAIKQNGVSYVGGVSEDDEPEIKDLVTDGLVNEPGAATCRGWDQGKALPAEICRNFTPNQDQLCTKLEHDYGTNRYPLLWHNNLLGPCECLNE